MPGANRKMCCLPKQWEGFLVDLKPKGKEVLALQMAHDDDSMREGYFVSVVGKDRPVAQVFKDFMDNKVYTVNMSSPNTVDYTCTVTKNTDYFFKSCSDEAIAKGVITNLKYIGDSRIGSETSGVVYDGWSYKVLGEIDIVIGLS